MAWGTIGSLSGAIALAGANANSTIIGVTKRTEVERWGLEAEGYLVAATMRDFVGDYASLNSSIKNAVDRIVNSLVAIDIIDYDPSGYTKLLEAQTIIDILWDRADKLISKFKDFKGDTVQAAV